MNSKFTILLLLCITCSCVQTRTEKDEWYVKLVVGNSSENGADESVDVLINGIRMVRGDSCHSELSYTFESRDLEVKVTTKDGRLKTTQNYTVQEKSDGVRVSIVYDNNLQLVDSQFIEKWLDGLVKHNNWPLDTLDLGFRENFYKERVEQIKKHNMQAKPEFRIRFQPLPIILS